MKDADSTGEDGTNVFRNISLYNPPSVTNNREGKTFYVHDKSINYVKPEQACGRETKRSKRFDRKRVDIGGSDDAAMSVTVYSL